MSLYKIIKSKNMTNAIVIQIIEGFFRIPVNIIISNMISNIISCAIHDSIGDIVGNVFFTFIIIFIQWALLLYLENKRKENLSFANNKCKITIFNHIFTSSFSDIYKIKYGDLNENLRKDLTHVFKLYVEYIPSLIINIVTVISYLVYIGIGDIRLSLIILIFAAIQIISPIVVSKFMTKNYADARHAEASILNHIISIYDGLMEFKIYNIENIFLNKLKLLHKDFLNIGKRSEKTYANEKIMHSFIYQLLTYGMYTVTGLMILGTYTTLNIGIRAIALSDKIFTGAGNVFNIIPQIAISKLAQNRIHELVNDQKYEFIKIENNILLNSISVSVENKVVLDKINFEVNKDDFIIIEGENGTGKSTLIKILLGAINFYEGKIVIDNKHSIMPNAKFDIIDNYFYIPQDDLLLDINTDHLIMVLTDKKYKLCIERILSMGLHYDKIKQQQFSCLSAGERKKILISVAFVQVDKFIVMDEPTNFLDKIGKESLKKFIIKQNKRIILVTHEKTLFEGLGKHYIIKGGKLNEKEHI